MARRIGSRLILEGKMTEGDSMSVGRTVSLIMKLQGNDFLYGYGDSFLAGARTGGGISWPYPPGGVCATGISETLVMGRVRTRPANRRRISARGAEFRHRFRVCAFTD